MADINVITLFVVTIGAIASIAVAVYTFQGPKVEISVKCIPVRTANSKIRSVALGEPESVNDEVYMKVVNVGHKNVEINMPNILLHDGRTFETSYTDDNQRSDLSQLPIRGGGLPNLLITGDSCGVRISLMKLADWLKRNDYNGEVMMRFQFSDATGNKKFESGKFSINVDEVLERTHPTET
jgi:hypothetical protein